MGALVNHTYSDWASGVITSMEPDEVPPNAYTRGYNTELVSIGGGRAVIRQRKGFALINATPVTGVSEIGGLFQYRKLVNDVDTTQYNLILSDNGRLDSISLTPATYGDLTTIDATAFTPRTVYGDIFQCCQANNIMYIVNGTDQKKFDGTNVYDMGIEAPLSAPSLAAGAAGSHTGTYEARVTYGNAAVGIESSAGPTSGTVVVAAQKISWTAIPVSPDPQVDTRYLYIRNTGTMENFFLVGTISDNVTTTYTSDVLDVALTTIGPDTHENDPPTAHAKYIAFHKNRLFVCDLENIYYSKLDNIEGFDPLAFESPSPNDGQHIFGMTVFADMLIMLKEHSIYALVGDDPDFWRIRQISTSVGCIGPRSVVELDGSLYWWSNQGAYRWNGEGQPEYIGTPFIQPEMLPGGTEEVGGVLFLDDNGLISYHRSESYRLSAGADLLNHRVLFSVPTVEHSSPHDNTGTRNTIIFPFNARLNRWEANKWDPLDISSLDTWFDDDEAAFVACGGYSGQMFRASAGLADGTFSGTLSGTFVASGTTAATITDGGAAFLNTGGKLVDRKVSIVDSTGALVTEDWRPHVTSNTATVLTLSETVTGLTSGDTYSYFIGAPAFDFKSAWLDESQAFFKKRYRFVYLHTRSKDIIQARVDAYTDYQQVDGAGVDPLGDPSTTLVSVDNSDTLSDNASRVRVAQTGSSIMVRVRHFQIDEEFWLLKLGLMLEVLNERLG